MWGLFKNKKIMKSVHFYTIPLFFVFLIAIFLGQKVLLDVQFLEETQKLDNQKILQTKWAYIENTLQILIDENYQLSQTLGNRVIAQLKALPPQDLTYALDTIGLDPQNKIQRVIGATLKNVYFNNLVSDANDPFAMIIRFGFDDSFIFEDYSENCAVDKFTRDLNIEIKMQGRKGNAALAEHTFSRIVNLATGQPLYQALFFQFEAPDPNSKKLSSFDVNGLKSLFFANGGDFWITFKSYEFLAPFYIYQDKSITGVPRIENRVKTGAPVIAIISVFSPYEVLSANESFKKMLDNYDDTQTFLLNTAQAEERFILTTGIISMVITILMFIVYWIFTQHVNSNLIKKNNDE